MAKSSKKPTTGAGAAKTAKTKTTTKTAGTKKTTAAKVENQTPGSAVVETPAATEATMPAIAEERKAVAVPTEEQIRRRAYEIYLERKGEPGNPLEDWARAERELRGS